ncbi:hypothetical protein PIIN_08108 [Serendipita indica DSM 11827]|uniref:Uncharacterized protein n=1 Tax=Serendipita indica (strain DSM 11827) TaxID=1109443 RepID=G4TS62_SERID|nr:hypothetical protein PIIN_08108 [Serendipita indica DSM 11827]
MIICPISVHSSTISLQGKPSLYIVLIQPVKYIELLEYYSSYTQDDTNGPNCPFKGPYDLVIPTPPPTISRLTESDEDAKNLTPSASEMEAFEAFIHPGCLSVDPTAGFGDQDIQSEWDGIDDKEATLIQDCNDCCSNKQESDGIVHEAQEHTDWVLAMVRILWQECRILEGGIFSLGKYTVSQAAASFSRGN